MIVRGAVVPHAPVVLEQVQPSLEAGRRLRSEVASLDLTGAEAVVVVSPHGPRAGVYGRPEGALHGFGIEDLEVARRSHGDVARALARAWDRPLIEGPADFGIVVPLLLGVGDDLPVVAVTLPEVTGPAAHPVDETLRDAAGLATALSSIAERHDLAIVASAHSSAGLSSRAPLTELAGALDVHRALLEGLEHDPAQTESVLERLHSVGNACGIGPLAALARLPTGRIRRRLSHEAPFGVGYLVGEWAS
ncbi:MAG: hypothetical protein ACRDK3_08555 [Actinomycetota bacterium]